MRKIIFLDIDGVLNSLDWFKRRKTLGPNNTLEEFTKNDFDPKAVSRLKRIIRQTGAEVVLSSTWRLWEDGRNDVKKYAVGFIDYTGNCNCRIRGVEINEWINKHIPYKERDNLRYAILDDDGDMLLWQKDNFFRTSWEHGLTNEIADKVIAHLNVDKIT